VIIKRPSPTWFMQGGANPNDDDPFMSDQKAGKDRIFYCQKWYDPNLARFEDPLTLPVGVEKGFDFCEGCYWTDLEDNRFDPAVGSVKAEKEEVTLYESVTINSIAYKPGDCIYVLPSVYDYLIERKVGRKSCEATTRDPVMFPEYYRKGYTKYIKGSNELCPPPYRVARILEIYTEKVG
jgi:DNA (cytosine-5)-methyltransferase 1